MTWRHFITIVFFFLIFKVVFCGNRLIICRQPVSQLCSVMRGNNRPAAWQLIFNRRIIKEPEVFSCGCHILRYLVIFIQVGYELPKTSRGRAAFAESSWYNTREGGVGNYSLDSCVATSFSHVIACFIFLLMWPWLVHVDDTFLSTVIVYEFDSAWSNVHCLFVFFFLAASHFVKAETRRWPFIGQQLGKC